MAVAFDAVSNKESNNASTISWTHTPVADPTAILVSVQKGRPANTSALTYGGSSMSLLGALAPDNDEAEWWGIVNPSTGAQLVHVTATGSNYLFAGVAQSFTGTNSTLAEAFTSFQSASGSASSGATTLTVTSATNDLVVDSIRATTNPGTDYAMAPGAGQTERLEALSAINGEDNYAVSDEAGAPSVSMDYSWNSSVNVGAWRYIAINVVASGGAPPPASQIPYRMLTFGIQ